MEYESFSDKYDRDFDPSGICFKDNETAKVSINKASEIADAFPEMSRKHVYGLALEYSLTNKHQEHKNFIDFVHVRYEQ